MNILARTALATGAMLAVATGAQAQKSADTLRIAINDPIPALFRYTFSVDEATHFTNRIYQGIIASDEHKGQFVPALAKSWKQVDATVTEFDLRDDVKFHNGNTFDADDIVETLTWVSDPQVQIASKPRYSWIKSAEKLGPYKVRVTSHRPVAAGMGLLAYLTPIFDKETWDTHKDKSNYGRMTPVGTGRYKVVEMGAQGFLVERYKDYKAEPAYERPSINRIRAVQIADRQTQQAQLMTGGLDMLRNVPPDVAKFLETNKDLDVSIVPTGYMLFFGLDAAGRSSNKVLSDPRVRRAIWMAIDRDSIIKHIVPGGDRGLAEKMTGLCFPFNIGCKVSVAPVEYDPAGAKKLLAEAGYPNGFDLEYTVLQSIRWIAEAISGDLHKIGIRVAINPVTFGVYLKNQGEDKLQAWSVFYPTTIHPDVGTNLDVYFIDRRDYANDSLIHDAVRQGASEMDPVKRTAIYEKALNRSNEMNYVMAVSSMPTVYAHAKTIKIERDLLSAMDTYIDDYAWK